LASIYASYPYTLPAQNIPSALPFPTAETASPPSAAHGKPSSPAPGRGRALRSFAPPFHREEPHETSVAYRTRPPGAGGRRAARLVDHLRPGAGQPDRPADLLPRRPGPTRPAGHGVPEHLQGVQDLRRPLQALPEGRERLRRAAAPAHEQAA